MEEFFNQKLDKELTILNENFAFVIKNAGVLRIIANH
jgi:hypothetical protein